MTTEIKKLSIMWFRRDLRTEDNTALQHALASGYDVLPVFLFDSNILTLQEQMAEKISSASNQTCHCTGPWPAFQPSS